MPSGWSDDPTGPTPSLPYEYVSQRRKVDGVWTAFSKPSLYATCKMPSVTIGNNGNWFVDNVDTGVQAEGKNGTGVEIKGTVANETARLALTGLKTGDCYIQEDNKHLYFWTGTIWRDLGEFKGEPGKSSYMHMAWADEVTFKADGVTYDTVKTNGTSGHIVIVYDGKEHDWIGFCTDDNVNDPGDNEWKSYKWNYQKGKDGDGYEYVYLRTTQETAPVIDTSNPADTNGRSFAQDEYLPRATNGSTIGAPKTGNYYQFTDDPQGVGNTYKYEYMSQRKKVDGSWMAFTPPTLHRVYASDGKNAVKIDLDNEYDSILYDGTGTTKMSGNVTTKAYLFDGITDVSANASFTISERVGVTEQQATISGRDVTVSGLTADAIVTIRAEYPKNSGTYYYAKFTVKKLLGIDKYDLIVTPNAIGVNTSNTVADHPITVKVKRTPGNGGNQSYVSFTNKSTNDYGLTIEVKDSKGNTLAETTGTAATTERTFNLTGSMAASVDNVTISLKKGTSSVLQDTETIPVNQVHNGIDGSGSNAVKIDLDNEMDSIPCDSEGVVMSRTILSTGARIYDGAASVTSGVTIKSVQQIAGVTAASSVTNGVVSISWTIEKNTRLSVDKFTAQIVLTWNSHDYYGTFTANVVKSGQPGVSPTIYQLSPSPSNIAFSRDSSGNLPTSPKTLEMKIKKTLKNNTELVTMAASGLTVLYRKYQMPTSSTDSQATAFPAAGLDVYATDNNIYIAAFSGTTLVDREVVPVVKDGANGTSPWIADLDNEMDSVACEYGTGKVAIVREVETNLSMYYGSTKKSFKITSVKRNGTALTSGTASNGVTATFPSDASTARTVKVKYATTAVINDKDDIAITLQPVDATSETRVLHFTINGIRPGKEGDSAVLYSLQPSDSQIVVKKNGTRVPSSNITCSVVKTDGKSSPVTATTGFTLKTFVDGTEKTSSTVSSISVNTSIVYELYIDTILVDRETIPVVADGNDGSNVSTLDIDNEYDMVQTTSSSVVNGAQTKSTIVRLYDGSTEVDISAETISTSGGPVVTGDNKVATFSQGSEANSGKGRVLSWAFIDGKTISDSYEITISYTYKSIVFKATFTISASKGQAVLQLKPSHSALSCAVNASNTWDNPPALSLKIVKLDSNSTSESNATNSNLSSLGVIVRYAKGANATMPATKTDGDAWPNNNSVQAIPSDGNVYIAMFNNAGVLLDRETIPLVKNGTTGGRGKRGDFKSRVFARTDTNIGSSGYKPTGGTYDSPWPGGASGTTQNGVTWYDGIPSGTATLWSSIRTFKDDDDTTTWSIPVKEADTVDLDIEFSPSETKPLPNTLRETPGGQHPSSNVWYDPSNLPANTDMIWRAERKIKGASYDGDWVISRIKGEKGDPIDISDPDFQEMLESAVNDAAAALKAGLTVLMNPQIIIVSQEAELTQSGGSYSNTFNPKKTDIQFLRDGEKVDITFNSATAYGFNSSGTAVSMSNAVSGSVSNKTATITLNSVTIGENKINGHYEYQYDHGYIVVRLTVETKTYELWVAWYLNRLGSRITETAGDVETTIATKLGFKASGSNVYSIEAAAAFITSASENTSRLEQIVTQNISLSDINAWESGTTTGEASGKTYEEIKGANTKRIRTKTLIPVTTNATLIFDPTLAYSVYILYFNSAKKLCSNTWHYGTSWVALNATEQASGKINLVTESSCRYVAILLKRNDEGTITVENELYKVGLTILNSPVSTTSEVQQTAESIRQTITGPNGISQQLQTLEQNITTVSNKITTANLISLLSWTDGTNALKNYNIKNGNVGYAHTIYSPRIYLEAGKYTFSAYMNNGVIEVLTSSPSSSSETSLGTQSPTSTSESYIGITRYKYTFTLSAAKFVRIKLYIPVSGTTMTAYYPQLEKGDTMSSYVPSADPVGSTGYMDIKANSVRLGVEQDLKTTGIDITHGKIDMTADKTQFNDMNGIPMICVEMLDGIPSIVFYDGLGKSGGKKMWVLNYKGLLQLKNTGEPRAWTSERHYGQIPTNTDIYASDVWNLNSRAGFAATTHYLYYAAYSYVNGNFQYNPSSGASYDKRWYNSNSENSDFLPTGSAVSGWWITNVAVVDSSRKSFTLAKFTSGKITESYEGLLEKLDVYNMDDTVVSSNYYVTIIELDINNADTFRLT